MIANSENNFEEFAKNLKAENDLAKEKAKQSTQGILEERQKKEQGLKTFEVAVLNPLMRRLSDTFAKNGLSSVSKMEHTTVGKFMKVWTTKVIGREVMITFKEHGNDSVVLELKNLSNQKSSVHTFEWNNTNLKLEIESKIIEGIRQVIS